MTKRTTLMQTHSRGSIHMQYDLVGVGCGSAPHRCSTIVFYGCGAEFVHTLLNVNHLNLKEFYAYV